MNTTSGTVSASAPLDEIAPGGRPSGPGDSRLALSFEVIPPGTAAGRARLPELISTLEGYAPDYVAITSSGKSGWAAGTRDFVRELDQTTRLRPLAHITCMGAPRAELVHQVEDFVDAGVRGFLAIRGDLEPGSSAPPAGHLAHANDLVELIRRVEARDFARFAAGRLSVGVAAYPSGHAESTGVDEDIDVLLAKQRAGADFAITQLFFDPEAYLRLLERSRLAGVHLPIVPGILPVTSAARLQRMAHLSGLTPPAGLAARLESASEAEQRDIGLAFTAELAARLLDGGAPGLHIYTFNNPRVVGDLFDRIDRGRLTTRNHQREARQ
jgi:methylenetetrahydrofolate reductase (NADPH)